MRAALIISFFFLLLSSFNPLQKKTGYVYSATGKIHSSKLGVALTHEHLFSNFGAAPAAVAGYDSAALFNQVLPYLKKIKLQGVQSIFDCTGAYFGRDVKKLQTLSLLSGINIITNTGFYGAANDKYVPAFAFSMSEEEIANIWINEFKNGIDSTTIKPGFIKLAFDDGEPSAIDIKLFAAGLLTHKATGLTLQVHTGNNIAAAKKQLELLKKYQLHPSAWIWAHANLSTDMNFLIETAASGAWISLDGVKESTIGNYVRILKEFKSKNVLHKVLLSHDGNSFPRGAAIRPYDAIQTHLIPQLQKEGFSTADIYQLTVKNPCMAFQIRVRMNK
ncbi:phosphotriesterase family protein [Lacibacter sediminis]|uniref:Phosphotriesterase n=1 Tax=Lacibacter sediminis TaxID=2760713 RepID=A0A7G5XKF9_9BACT|nr:phosphotriesterase [Lacibacter sediminis]QNA45962.1 phosphotriesterase [Lacibacter sediminis]